MASRLEIEAAAAAIANARAARRGAPAIENVLEILRRLAITRGRGSELYSEVIQDATAALDAAERVRSGVETRPAGESKRESNRAAEKEA